MTRASRKVLPALLSISIVAAAAFAFAAKIDVPKPTGTVVDQAGILDAGTKRRIEALNQELRAKTGSEIAVVTVKSTQPETAFDYAMAVAESWKPGSREKDNGVVFLVATDDREMYILTGYGVEGVLPDGRVGEIRDTIVVPAFRQGDFSRGILDATTTMASLIAQDAGVKLSGVAPVKRPQRARPGLGSLIPLVILGLILFSLGRSFFGSSLSGRRGRRRRGMLEDVLTGVVLGGGFGGRGHGGFGGGGGFGGLGGGGFGGFGGGGFGGGGAGGRW